MPSYSDESKFTDVLDNHLSAEKGTGMPAHVHIKLQHMELPELLGPGLKLIKYWDVFITVS